MGWVLRENAATSPRETIRWYRDNDWWWKKVKHQTGDFAALKRRWYGASGVDGLSPETDIIVAATETRNPRRRLLGRSVGRLRLKENRRSYAINPPITTFRAS